MLVKAYICYNGDKINIANVAEVSDQLEELVRFDSIKINRLGYLVVVGRISYCIGEGQQVLEFYCNDDSPFV